MALRHGEVFFCPKCDDQFPTEQWREEHECIPTEKALKKHKQSDHLAFKGLKRRMTLLHDKTSIQCWIIQSGGEYSCNSKGCTFETKSGDEIVAHAEANHQIHNCRISNCNQIFNGRNKYQEHKCVLNKLKQRLDFSIPESKELKNPQAVRHDTTRPEPTGSSSLSQQQSHHSPSPAGTPASRGRPLRHRLSSSSDDESKHKRLKPRA